ncbi:MAG: hypothetical protein JWP36_254 [Paucimonas sp.]|nr:hypothetical protein [Paucimonas sp.]
MASEAPAATPARPRRRGLRALAWLAALLVLLLVALLAGAAWLVGTEAGARQALALAARAGGGTLAIDGVQGRLADRLELARVTWTGPDMQVRAQQVVLSWDPMALLKQRLHVQSLSAQRVDIALGAAKKDEPPKLPASLDLPLALQIDHAEVGQTVLARGPLRLAELGRLGLGLDYDGNRYRLQLAPLKLRATDPALPVLGEIKGGATLGSRQPFALDGRFTLDSSASLRGQQLGARGDAVLSGSLAEMGATLALEVPQSGEPARVDGHFALRPFSAQPLSTSRLTARGVDLSFFSAGAPATRLDADLAAHEDGRGTLSIGNKAAGTLDAKALPLTSLALRFAQQQGALRFDQLRASLGTAARPAGMLRGEGSLSGGVLELALQAEGVDLARIDARARKTRLSGPIALRHVEGRDELTLALAERAQGLPLDLDLKAVLAGQRVTLERIRLRAAGGEASASGSASLDGAQAFAAEGTFSRFTPRAFGQFAQLPDLLLNGRFSLKGTRAPALAGTLQLAFTDSRLAGQPLAGRGSLALKGDRLDVPELQLQAGDNALQLAGSLAPERQSGELHFTLAAPRLDQLGLGWRGALQASGSARGTARAPTLQASWQVQGLELAGLARLQSGAGQVQARLDPAQAWHLAELQAEASLQGLAREQLSVANLALRAQFSPRPEAPLLLDLQAGGLSDGTRMLDTASIKADGSTAQHAIALRLARARQTLSADASGGLQNLASAPAWRGMLQKLESTGRLRARLAQPALLQVSAARQLLEQFRLELDGGTIEVAQFAHDARSTTTRGRLQRLDLARLLALAGKPPPVATDLLLEGEWDLALGQSLNGRASLRRISGDVTVLGASQVKLGLAELQASLQARENRVEAVLDAKGSQLGQVALQAGLALQREGQGFSIARGGALSGAARIAIPSLAWVGGLASQGLVTEGRLQSDVSLAGTLAAPRVSGQVRGENLRLFLAELGVDLRQGQLEASFDQDRLNLARLEFAGGAGKLALSGPIGFAGGQPSGQLLLTAERYTLFNRSDRRLVLSGNSRIELGARAARIGGSFKVDSGMIDIGKSDLPQLSEDVVIVGQKKKGPAALAPEIDLALNLGDQLQLRGRGLDAWLNGELRIRNKAGEALQTEGLVRVARGSFAAYGRELKIEQGSLRFTGSMTNPALDILAMRRGQEVEAGVSVRGTVLSPRVVLVSEPPLPEAEKLSWLVLGRGLSGSEGPDLAALQSAAASLLTGSAGAGVQGQLAAAFGVDTINLSRSQDTLQQRIVTVGKQVSSRLYVSVVQGLETASSGLRLRYTLTPRLTVEAEAGTRSVFSLFYNLAFD